MTVFDLLFVFLFFATAATSVGVLILVVIGKGGAARRISLTACAVWVVYLVALGATDVAARQLVVAPGQDRCFDEMCFAVIAAQTLNSSPAAPDHTTYIITIRATSRSLGHPQAEGGLRARLYSEGKYINVSEQAQRAYDLQNGKTPQISQRLAPGETIASVLVFDVPREFTRPALTLDHGFTPGYLVIGESPFFHEPDILQLPAK